MEGGVIIADERIPVVRGAERFDAFYRREYRPVAGLAYVLSGSSAAAEDVTQEAFVAAYRDWDRIGSYEKPGAWVRRVVANKAASAVRRRVAEAKAVARLGGRLTPDLELTPETDEVWREVRKLPKRQAQTLALKYLEDRSIEDIGDILGMSPGTVKAHLRRGRTALARRLDIEEVS